MSIKDFLKRTASGLAAAVTLPSIRLKPEPQFKVSAKCAHKGTPFRRIIGHQVFADLIRQTGTVNVQGDSTPRLQQYSIHRFLHATKGWRQYTRYMPRARPSTRPTSAGGYYPNGHWVARGWQHWRADAERAPLAAYQLVECGAGEHN